MTIGNIVALDTNTVTKWQTLINNAGPSTPIANRVPEALDDNYRTTTDTPVRGNVLANDTDPDGDALLP